MGAVVFGTYDGFMKLWEILNGEGQCSDEASVVVHGGAGAAAGVAQSLVWMGWEQWVAQVSHSNAYRLRTTCHHSLAFGSLFGSYQATHYFLIKTMTVMSRDAGASNEESSKLSLIASPSILATGLAGGYAGMVHHIVHHYSSHWRRHHATSLPPLPRVQPTIASFLPMSLCFLALEYGGEGAEEIYDRITGLLGNPTTA